MPDSKDNTQSHQTKTLSNSLRLKSPNNVKRRQNVSNILNRLPYLRTLNEAQNKLLRVTPVWQKWCAAQTGPNITDFASPASLDGKTLTISCKQSSTATILKHTQNSLLDALQKHGFEQIQSIRIKMSLDQNSDISNSDLTNKLALTGKNSLDLSAAPNRKPSAASLKSIESTQSLVSNEHLAASLKRLAETLKKVT